MRSSVILVLVTIIVFGFFGSCKRKTSAKNFNDTYNSGTLKMVVDESFAPIVNQEIYVFKNDNPKANPVLSYRSENSAIQLLLEDSVRFAFLSRDLTPGEKSVLQQRNLPTETNAFALDAVAIIVNQASADTAISVSEIKKMLKGQIKTDRNIVFDNPNSGLVRYLKELTGEASFEQKNIYALKTNKEVIKYVSENPKAIGIADFSWIDDPDADYADAVKKVRVLAVKDESNKKAPDQYFMPSQSTLYLKQYPLERSLYMVNCTGRDGLGTGLELFIRGDKGQRIILKSGLLPVLIPERNIVIIHSNKL